MFHFFANRRLNWPLIIGALVSGIVFFLTAKLVMAQDDGEPDAPVIPVKECQECHLDVANYWQDSAHAHAFDDEVFQAQWQSLGEPEECLACHTGNNRCCRNSPAELVLTRC